jgi:hypothetical protein
MRRGLKLLLLTAFFSAVTAMAQETDGEQGKTADIPGTTAVSHGIQENNEAETSNEQNDQPSSYDTVPNQDSQPLKPAVVTGVTAISQDYEERKSVTISRT